MNTVGIIAEYNPFHLGHKYHIEKSNADYVIAIMGGNFTQRGDASIFNKFIKAEFAVKNGVDLVIELPFRFSIASAEKFAFAGVYLLDALGVADTLSFGSETGRLVELQECAKALQSLDIKEFLSSGVSFPKARAAALKKAGVFVPENPNDILGVEYIKALNKIKSTIKPFTIQRQGLYYGGNDGFESASQIRKNLENKENIERIPQNVYDIFQTVKKDGSGPGNIEFAQRAVLDFLRNCDPKEMRDTECIFEGLENRICSSAKKATSLREIYELSKSKRYTRTAIQRAVLALYTNLKKSDIMPTYIRVLAQNTKGNELLKKAKKTAKLPIIHSLSDVYPNDLLAREEVRAGNLYSICTPEIQPAMNELIRKSCVIVV